MSQIYTGVKKNTASSINSSGGKTGFQHPEKWKINHVRPQIIH